jgi:hypothetical protein
MSLIGFHKPRKLQWWRAENAMLSRVHNISSLKHMVSLSAMRDEKLPLIALIAHADDSH